jgi:hypothetical protein
MSSDAVDRDVGKSDNDAHNLPTEFLDDTSDAHATMFGFWKGFRGLKAKAVRTESKREIHYFQFGYVLGRVFQLVFAAVAGGIGMSQVI